MSILLDQLMGEREFLRYCREDYLGGIKNDIGKELLYAAISDGFLKPVAYSNDDSKEPLFSPFQIYIVSSLSNNIVLDGGLWSQHNVDFHKSLGQRFVSWGNGGYSFNFNYAKEGINAGPNDVIKLCNNYDRFLRLLHSCSMLSDYLDEDTYNNRRHFTAAPDINYDFSTLTKSTGLLEEYDLSLQILSDLYIAIGRFASDVDPLRNWYYYIKRHSRSRKDELRGSAALAQDMYIVCELIERMMRSVDDKVSSSLFETLDKPLLRLQMLPHIEYAEGTDSKVLLYVISLFEKWSLDANNAFLVDTSVRGKLLKLKEDINIFVGKYGDRYYQNGIRNADYETKISLKDLDQPTKFLFEQYWKQRKQGEKLEDGEIEMEIANAIEWRLDHLSRELWSIFEEVGKKLQEINSAAWYKSHNNLGEKRTLKQHHELYQIALKAQEKKDDFYSMLDLSRRIYCASCRNNFVQLHVQQNDSIVTYDHLCDDCIAKRDITRNKGVGEWGCSQCGERLLKFVNQNVMSEQLLSGQLIDLKLDYGRLTIKTKCKHCKTENSANIDWGWNP